MERDESMRCPHCSNVGPCIWVGYGRDWVICSHCQRRVRWSEARLSDLVQRDRDSKAEALSRSYH